MWTLIEKAFLDYTGNSECTQNAIGTTAAHFSWTGADLFGNVYWDSLEPSDD